ncbi:MAG: septation protein A [Alphaproteobacteria bacterium]
MKLQRKGASEKGWVKVVTDYGPLVVFFIAYRLWDLYVATAALMGATAVALFLSLAINRRVPLMPMITAGIVGVFGALTLIFNDDTFIKMKPTIVQALIAAILLGGLVLRRALLKPVMGTAWPMTDPGWRILTRNFGFFFLVMAVANELVWRTQTEDFWVNFKVFGIMALTLAFSMTQIPVLNRYRIDDEGRGD